MILMSCQLPSLDASAQLSGSAEEIRAAALTEEFQLRPATIALGALDDAGNLSSSEVTLAGKMQDIALIDDAASAPLSTVQIESVFSTISQVTDLRLSSADHARFES